MNQVLVTDGLGAVVLRAAVLDERPRVETPWGMALILADRALPGAAPACLLKLLRAAHIWKTRAEDGPVLVRLRTAMRRARRMNVIYNSDNYYVVEYPAGHGYELVDKRSGRGTFFHGDVADKFVLAIRRALAEEASAEHVDEFLGSFDVLLNNPVVYH